MGYVLTAIRNPQPDSCGVPPVCFAEGMTLEEQVCSLELAKKLKELGVKQESLCYWLIPDSGFERLVLAEALLAEGTDGYSAFTVAELGEMLPKGYITWRAWITKADELWWICEKQGYMGDDYPYSKTEADARAKMLARLSEKKPVNREASA